MKNVNNFNEHLFESSDLTVAKEIYNQLGKKAMFMMGAKNIAGDNNSLSFKISGSPKYNFIKITLNSLDLYDVKFIKYFNYKITREVEVNNVYNDQLKDVIEKNTGLYLSL
jgi:hypothetical protein